MTELARHELFELETLHLLKNRRLLNAFVFGGGTMLRLCYELNRYSADLDFVLVRRLDTRRFLDDLRSALAAQYQVTDAEIKQNTILCEVRSPQYPRRLKLEFRTHVTACDWQERIAFSKHGTRQVILKALTLEAALQAKLRAALSRKIIRDFFDIEFILRRGVALTIEAAQRDQLIRIIHGFTRRDYTTVLGSLLEKDERTYYARHGFAYLLAKLQQ